MENKFPTTPDEMRQMMQEWLPQVKTTKTGYEIRAKILEMAQTQAFQPIIMKYGTGFGLQVDQHGNEFKMSVDIPDATAVLEIANKFLEFVNKKD